MPGGVPPPTERSIQRSILAMIRQCFPTAIYHHSAVTQLSGSAAQRGMQMGAMKGDGFKVGFPDLVVLWAAGKTGFLEVKRPKLGKVSPEQEALHAQLAGMGHKVAIVRSVDEAYTFLRSLGAPWSGIDPRLNKTADEYHPEAGK